MGVSCVQSIAISDGRSGQQIIDTISKQLESMNGRKCGTFCVECDTYYSSLPINTVKVLNLLTSTEFPMTCFALLDNGQSLVCDSTFELILHNLSNVYSSKKMSRIEVRGQKWTLKDFVVRVGSCCLGPSLKGIIIELEYGPSLVPNHCWDLIKELAQSFADFPDISQPNQYMISRMNEIYSPIDTIQQYNDHFNTLRKAQTIQSIK